MQRLLECRPNPKAKRKKAENQNDLKVQTVSVKDSASENESKPETPNKRECPVKNNKSTNSKISTGYKTSRLRVWTKICAPARGASSPKTVKSERTMLPSKRIVLARRAAVGTVLSARQKHVLKIASSVKKRTDDFRQNKVTTDSFCICLLLIQVCGISLINVSDLFQSSRVTRSRSDVKETKPDVADRCVNRSSLKRKPAQTESDEKRETRVSRPSSPAGELSSFSHDIRSNMKLF